MDFKNIKQTNDSETLIPIYYIDHYKDEKVKNVFNEYKFKGKRHNPYLIGICTDICINFILENPDSNILFTYPPSTMFYRKEKSIDIYNIIQ